ncbi:MAG: aminopeptidase [Chloroflexota bacterium]
MADPRVEKFAHILVDYSTRIKAGERVAVWTAMPAEPLARVLYGLILERGAYPHILMDFPDQDELLFAHASDELLDFVPIFHKLAFSEFDVLLKVYAKSNTRALTNVDPVRQARRQKSVATLIATQMQRGATGALRWMSTIFPTHAYAMEAEMGFEEFQDFAFAACHADENTPDPVAYWESVQADQRRYIEMIEGRDRVEVRGPDVDLTLSIKGRKFVNACGTHNLPDGEIYTGPVENSANGWVRFSLPAVYQGNVVEGVELTFKEGKVVKATAEKNEAYLLQMLDSDPGARYLGEFAIGTNYQINRFTRNILYDEKTGGSFHLALGAGYPETGNTNRSAIHWDMICDLRHDSEILVDHQLIYRNGQFVS